MKGNWGLCTAKIVLYQSLLGYPLRGQLYMYMNGRDSHF